jgi:hypothetical protein
MGDIFSHDEDARCAALGIAPQDLRTAWAGEVWALDGAFQALRAHPSDTPGERAELARRSDALAHTAQSLHDRLLERWYGLAAGNDLDSAECRAFVHPRPHPGAGVAGAGAAVHLRDVRRSLLRMVVWVRTTDGGLGPGTAQMVEDYEDLVRRVRRNADADGRCEACG